MAEIPIKSSPRPALVDDEDYERIVKWHWSLTGGGYLKRQRKVDNHVRKFRYESMHRLVMGMDYGDKRHVDHINGDPLDNRKCNLRICEPIENWRSCKRRKDNTSGYKGVSWSKSNKKWNARIKHEGKRISLGYFVTPEAAHAAYCKAADELFGEFARYE